MKLTFDNVEQVINNNKHLFKTGTTITEQELCKLTATKYRQRFKSHLHRDQYQMRKLYIYTRFNKLLALRGLYIRAHNYYSSFEVLTAKDTAERIDEYQIESKAKKEKAKVLALGATHYKSKWKPLTSIERNSFI